MTNHLTGARASIIKAFNRLVLQRRVLRPPVAEILDEAGVARSTFYGHFEGRDQVLLEALREPLSVVADAALGTASGERLAGLLRHFHEQRRGAREMLSGSLAPRMARALAELIRERDTNLTPAGALRLADMEIGLIRLWITGETPGPAEEIAQVMVASAKALRTPSPIDESRS